MLLQITGEEFSKKLLNSFEDRIQRLVFKCLLTREKCEIIKKGKKVCGKLTEIENEDCYFFMQKLPRYFKNGTQSIFFIFLEKKTENLSKSHANS